MTDIIQLQANLGNARSEKRESKDVPPMPSQAEVEAGSASWMHWRLVNLIADFEADLAETREIGIRLAGEYGPSPIRVETITYWNPDLLVITGTDTEGSPIQYTHHVFNVNYALVGLPKAGEKPVRIAEALRASIVGA